MASLDFDPFIIHHKKYLYKKTNVLKIKNLKFPIPRQTASLSIAKTCDSKPPAPPTPTETYANKKVLVEPDVYILYWNYNSTDITFELQVKSLGWAGFGLSPNGEMENSNVILFWMNSDGTSNFTERNTNGGTVTPTINTEQLWFSLLTKTQDGYLISKSTRKIKFGDTTSQHKDIDAGTPHVIYSWGSNFVNGDAAPHRSSDAGTKSVPLVSSLNSDAKK